MRAEEPLGRASRRERVERRFSLKAQNGSSTHASGLYDSNSVQDRIRQWQAHGAADALDPDAVSVRSLPVSEALSLRSRPVSEYGDSNRGRIKQQAREEAQDREAPRSNSTPRKRIISDGHWKSKRPAKGQNSAKPLPKPPVEPTRYDLSYTSSHDVHEKRRRSHRREHPEPTRVPSSEGVHYTGAAAQGDRRDGRWRNGAASPPSDDGMSHLNGRFANVRLSQPQVSDELEALTNTSNQADGTDVASPAGSRYAETLGRTPFSPIDNGSKISGLFGKTKGMLMKSDTLPAVNTRIPSIEAWLDEQPDPFRDEMVPADGSTPKNSPPRRPRAPAPRLVDDNHPPTLDPAFQESSPRSQQTLRPELEPTSDTRRHSTGIDQSVETSPSNLRRRGANVRRTRGSLRPQSLAYSDTLDAAKLGGEGRHDDNEGAQTIDSTLAAHPPVSTYQMAPATAIATKSADPSFLNLANDSTGQACGLKRRLTTHEDLMSVLSLPKVSGSRRAARRRRSVRGESTGGSASEVLAALLSEEEKYARELHTLVEGVIPVLLQSVLSKADSAAAAGLFASSTTEDPDFSFTRPIIDMGIALERLKTLHARMPLQSVDSLLTWAQAAQKAYRDYIQSWRLGFQNVVVNLEPLDKSSTLDQGIPRDRWGDLVNTEGERVDVAYLLKRPLVRVKTLSKTFGQIRDQCDRPLAAQMADSYADLGVLAKRRYQEEQARLEDEAAANIDAMRARDMRTLAATAGVAIDRTRRVRARDFFNLTLYHSSGQRMDCGIELIFRDDARPTAGGGDVLICEVEDTGKWLLFAPVELNSISARRGESGFDLVVMVRGRAGLGQDWHELLALKTDDAEAVAEWMNMLGSNPLPPGLNRTSSFLKRSTAPATSPNPNKSASAGMVPKPPDHGQISKPDDLDVPLGEPSLVSTRGATAQRPAAVKPLFEKSRPQLHLGGGLVRTETSTNPAIPTSTLGPSVPSANLANQSLRPGRATRESTAQSVPLKAASPKSIAIPNVRQPNLARSPPAPLFPETLQRRTVRGTQSPAHQQADSSPTKLTMSPHPLPRNPDDNHTAQTSPSWQKAPALVDGRSPQSARQEEPVVTARPPYHRSPSSTPSREAPVVTKVRPQAHGQRRSRSEDASQATESPRTTPSHSRQGRQAREDKSSSRSQIFTEDIPPLPPMGIRQMPSPQSGSSPPSTPPQALTPHRTTGSSRPGADATPKAVSKSAPSSPFMPTKRKNSSPLKHEYAPSVSSESASDYDSDGISDSSSETSEEARFESGDKAMPLVAITAGARRPSKPSYPPPSSMPSTGTRTLAPSDSASQAPYRKVPLSGDVPAQNKSKMIALICSWSDKGMWEQVHPDECSIVISPGLIEAFEMSAAHSDSRRPVESTQGADVDSTSQGPSRQPLVAFELTPIVPLRRGTALDISIRSPPTANSKIRTTNNVMFRSRNPEECEALYGMINWARCNNPTYIQLQAARPRQPSVTFNVGSERHSRSKSGSWFSFGSQKSFSYRASSAPTPASIAMSAESSGTTASAFSLLKRFGVNSPFNLNRSSVVRGNDHVGTGPSLYSSSSGTETGSGSGASTPAPSQLGFIPGKDGPNVPSTSAAAADGGGMINSMKIRLYIRKGQHWENLGAARLSVLPAPPMTGENGGSTPPTRPGTAMDGHTPISPGHGRSPSAVTPMGPSAQSPGPRLASSGHTPHRFHGDGREKRILITKNKDPQAVLLDRVLGESCFERIMQTGIAVKVWSADEVIGTKGGVTMGKENVYMLQFPGTREAGWVFGLCGTYRYGVGAE